MKYCRSCKTRANDTDTVCAKCGQPLAVLGGTAPPTGATGGSAAAATSTGPALTLQGQINQLEAVQRQNLRRSSLLAIVSGGIGLALVTTLYIIYSHTVLSYAVLRDVKIEQDSSTDNNIRVSFDVVAPGKVAFDRQSGGRRTEKLDVFTDAGRKELAWQWPSDKQTGIDFAVVYRGGWTRSESRKHFDVTGKSGAVDIVFLLDTTTSMDPFIDGLKKKCIDFAAVVRKEGYDCRLGLIGFGDVNYNEPITVYEPTGDLQLFQTQVSQLRRTSGGDEPESSVEALRRALDLQYRSTATVCFVHITDAGAHHEDQLPLVAQELKRRMITTYVVSLNKFANRYSPLCVNGGKFYAIEDAKFEDILLGVARSIASQIGYR